MILAGLGFLLNLSHLRLSYNNEFTGNKTHFVSLQHLKLMHLQGNRLCGTIPELNLVFQDTPLEKNLVTPFLQKLWPFRPTLRLSLVKSLEKSNRKLKKSVSALQKCEEDGDDVGGLEEIGGCGGGSGEGGGDGCGNTLVQLPSVNDATFMTTMFLTRPTTSICCRASARGCPPTTNSIQHRINDDYIGR